MEAKKAVLMVKEFYIKFRQEKFLRENSIKRYQQRLEWYLEEVTELNKAIAENDRVEILDALVDMLYIKIGTLLENFRVCNVERILNEKRDSIDLDIITIFETLEEFNFSEECFESAFEEVHNSNMSKLGEDGNPILREDGKIMKGPNYFRPNLKRVLEEWD